MKLLIWLLLMGSAFGQIYPYAPPSPAAGVVAVAIDNVGSGETATQVASLTWTQTVGGSANLLFIFVTTINGHAISTMTVNGSATGVTAVTSRADGNGSTLTSMYAMVAPPSGTVTMVATPSATDFIVGNSISFTGTNETYATPVTTDGKNTTGQPTATVTGVPASDLVVCSVGVGLNGAFSSYTFTPGGSQVSQAQEGSTGADGGNLLGTLASTGSVVMSWTIATGTTPWYWGEIAVDVHHQ
jgi:hypothetical protein